MIKRIITNASKASLAVAAALIVGLLLAAVPAFADAGDLDRSFGKDGRVITQLGNNDEAYAVVAQPDGKVVAAGVSGGDFALTRYDRKGSLDETFGEDGKVFTDLGAREVANALVLQPDGKIVVAGYTRSGEEVGDFALARYNPDGSLDETFGEDGAVISDFSDREEANALVVQPDDRLAIAVGGVVNDFILARYDPDGSLDGSFGSDGTVTTDFGVSRANALVVQTDGRFVAAGTRYGREGGQDFALVRYNQDGTRDRSFGRNGRVTTDFAGNKDDAAFALALQPNGRLIAAGETTSSRPANSDFALARYDTSGRRER